MFKKFLLLKPDIYISFHGKNKFDIKLTSLQNSPKYGPASRT